MFVQPTIVDEPLLLLETLSACLAEVLIVLRAHGVCSLHKHLFVQFTVDVLVLDISCAQATALQLAGSTLDGMIHLCSLHEHLFAVVLLDLVALWLLGQTRGLRTC